MLAIHTLWSADVYHVPIDLFMILYIGDISPWTAIYKYSENPWYHVALLKNLDIKWLAVGAHSASSPQEGGLKLVIFWGEEGRYGWWTGRARGQWLGKGSFRNGEVEDESGQLNRLRIPGTAAFLEVSWSRNSLLVLDIEDSCQQVAPNCRWEKI